MRDTSARKPRRPDPQLPEDPAEPRPPATDEPPNAEKPPKHPKHDEPMEPPDADSPHIDLMTRNVPTAPA